MRGTLVGAAAGLLACGLTTLAQEPVRGDYRAHDPSTMIEDNGRYYIFRTSDGIMIKSSTDKVNWTYGGQVFPSGPPAWTTAAVPGFDGLFWAPDIAYFNGRYHLYYSCSTWGSQVSAIGLVTSPSLDSPTWTDQGPVIQSSGAVAYNAIDPSILVDDDSRVWMAFGSYWNGIHLIELNPLTGGRIASNSPLFRLADNGQIEAACLFKRGRYYYLFVNHGTCCSGIDSTYQIKVGRSPSVTGPYLDRDNVPLVSGGGTTVLESTGRFVGPGHAGIFPESGEDWFSYHYYDANNAVPGEATLGLARLHWTEDGWPVVVNDWAAFYSFEADAREHRGRYDGTLEETAAVVDVPGRGAVLELDGSAGFVSLPPALANASTFAVWAKWNGGGTWQRIFDFGDGIGRYLFLSPRAANGRYRFAITTTGGNGEHVLDGPTSFPEGSWCHLAVTLDEYGTGLMYFNGEPVATNRNMTLRPWQVQARNNYLGKSQWPDPLFNGQIDSLRVFGRVVPPTEIRDLAHAHPGLAHRYSFAADARDPLGRAHGVRQGNAVIAGGLAVLEGQAGDYIELPGGLVSGGAATSVEFWAAFGANGGWSRVFDFGRTVGGNGQAYLFFSPHTGFGDTRLELATPGGRVTLTGTGTLDRQSVHVVCIADPTTDYAAVYVNGALAAEQIGALPSLDGISSELSYIGRSLFSADAWLNASIDEFRIYEGRLTTEEIAASRAAGPNGMAIPGSVELRGDTLNLTLSWPADAVGVIPEFTPVLNTGSTWSPLVQPPALSNDRWRVTFPIIEPSAAFRTRR